MSCPGCATSARLNENLNVMVCNECGANLGQAVADEAYRIGILEEPLDVSDSVGARIEDRTLILTFPDGTITVPDEPATDAVE
jgi:hypothetical protein